MTRPEDDMAVIEAWAAAVLKLFYESPKYRYYINYIVSTYD